jgi:cell division topological specificity factor
MAMFENVGSFFKKFMKNEPKELLAETTTSSKDAAKERLHVVLMQDRANVSADFLELMKEEIIEVIKKYIVVDESQIDVRLTNQENEDGSLGAPLLHANIPILNIRNDVKGEYLKENSQNVIPSPIEDDDAVGKTQVIQLIKEVPEETEEGINAETILQDKALENTEVEEDSNKFENDVIIEKIDNTEIFTEDLEKEENSEVTQKIDLEEKIESSKINAENEAEDLNTSKEPAEEKHITIGEDGNVKVEDIDSILDDYDDDDITFDDLLKAAEEEERLKEIKNFETEKFENEKSETEEETLNVQNRQNDIETLKDSNDEVLENKVQTVEIIDVKEEKKVEAKKEETQELSEEKVEKPEEIAETAKIVEKTDTVETAETPEEQNKEVLENEETKNESETDEKSVTEEKTKKTTRKKTTTKPASKKKKTTKTKKTKK